MRIFKFACASALAALMALPAFAQASDQTETSIKETKAVKECIGVDCKGKKSPKACKKEGRKEGKQFTDTQRGCKTRQGFDFSTLNLTPDQQKKIDKLENQRKEEIQNLQKAKKEEKAKLQEKRTAARAKYDKELQSILTPEQYAKYQQVQKERKEQLTGNKKVKAECKKLRKKACVEKSCKSENK